MACNGSTCQSNCYKGDEQDLYCKTAKSTNSDSVANNDQHNNLCIKCKVNDAISGYGGVDDGRFCADCFRSNMFGKFRFAVTSNAMISPTDKVLVAFSGGPSSRVALQFVHEMQCRAQKNFDASRDRSLPVFGVGVVFIDESAGSPDPSNETEMAMQEISLIVSTLGPPSKELYIAPIESIYSFDRTDGRKRLKEMLNAVNDPTGKEDLICHFRMLALQKIASENGYSRVLLGSCTSRIASYVISATVKGQGYSLPADIQYVDARWDKPVVLPLRDCLAQEIDMLCRIDGLKTVELSRGPGRGINDLVSSFVALLQEENPSRECTIMRTAAKLIPFHFNKIPEINDDNVPLATRRRQKRYNLKSIESILSESFCPICNSPLNKSDSLNLSKLTNCQQSIDIFGAACCSSCRIQILPSNPSSMEHFYSILPPQMVAHAKQYGGSNLGLLREQIQDCLLSDSEDET